MSPTKVSSVRLDQELLSQAKKLGLNLSQILTRALTLEIQGCNTGVVQTQKALGKLNPAIRSTHSVITKNH